MDRTRGLLFLLVFVFAPLSALPQDLPPQPKPGAKVCVAIVSNMSARSALVDRLTERLSKDLRDDKIKAVTMDSGTTTDPKLHPTRENGEEAKSRDCDYMLLTQIVDPKTRRFDLQSTQISIAVRVTISDSSDLMGSSSRPRYMDNLTISFTRFPRSRLNPVLD